MNKRFHVYKSSAGSGKTFTLVKEFLKLCFREQDNYFSNILAITFTNKATQELKSRLLESLKELASSKEEKGTMAAVLAAELEMSEEKIAQKAAGILSSILHHYGDFSISTIDRFSHRLIRTFAKDLKLPMNFQLEIDANRILEESVATLIEAVGRDTKLTKFLIDFVLFRVEKESNWRLEKDLKNFSQNLISDVNAPYLEALGRSTEKDFKELRKSLRTAIADIELKFNKLKEKGQQLLAESQLPLSSFYQGNKGIGNYFNKINLEKADSFIENSYMQKSIEEDKWYSSKTTESEKAQIDNIKVPFMEIVDEIRAFKQDFLAKYYAYLAIRNNIYSLSLIKEIDQRIEQNKKEERLLPIADFNKKIAEVVLQQSIPFIYVRLGERYNHLMIDEFQDTSVLQYMNLLPLMENAISEGKMNMIVGDAKQAIYRFRGGEARQLAEMPEFIHRHFEHNDWVRMRMETMKQQYQEVSLSTNYRSMAAIVEFNNKFFSFLSNYDLLYKNSQSVYRDYEQKIKPEASGKGMVEIAFMKDKAAESHLEYTLLAVREAIESNYQQQDIAVLCRENDKAIEVANFLKENNVDVISSEALLIKNIPQVKFLVDMARWIAVQDDVKAKKDIISFIAQQKGVEESLDEYFEKYIKNSADLRTFFLGLGLNIDMEKLSLLPLHLLFESLIRSFALNKKFDIYIQSFQEEVLTFVQNNGNNLNSFIDWWEEHQDQLALDIPQGIDAVEVMTIHKSKGLDYPVIIIPFLKNQKKSVKGEIWVPSPPELQSKVPYTLVQLNSQLKASLYQNYYYEEEQQQELDLLNVMYVAFTRAANRLYLCCDPPPKSDSVSPASLLDVFVKKEALTETIEEEYTKYNWGKPSLKREEDHKSLAKANAFGVDYHSAPWDEKLRISKTAQNNWQYAEDEESTARYYGNLLHDILAEINYEQESLSQEITAVIEKRLFAGEIDAAEKQLLYQKINKIVNHPRLKSFYDCAVKRKKEAALITTEGKMLRPDLVVMFKDKWIVVDYKTGLKSEDHQAQLQSYMQALSEMTALPIEGMILYTNSLEILNVA